MKRAVHECPLGFEKLTRRKGDTRQRADGTVITIWGRATSRPAQSTNINRLTARSSACDWNDVVADAVLSDGAAVEFEGSAYVRTASRRNIHHRR